MLICKYYNEEKKIEECFYESSNVYYSKCIDTPNALKTLIIVFKNGATYTYKDIDVKDYLNFRNDDSQGTALNKYINIKINNKPKYQYFRMSNSNLDELNVLLNEIRSSKVNTKKENKSNIDITFNIKEDKSFNITINSEGEVYSLMNENDCVKNITNILDILKIPYSKHYE